MDGLTDVDEIKGHTEARAKLQMAKEDLQSVNEELQLEVKEHEQA